uniref:TCHQD class glutathione S-transferase n=2 Tax=Physcomitrium patens TaxID=3218 RepID=A0A2K1L0V8_PHYPA|nr:hypothetical protein PHYPA_002461 [Physcomitrium patens]
MEQMLLSGSSVVVASAISSACVAASSAGRSSSLQLECVRRSLSLVGIGCEGNRRFVGSRPELLGSRLLERASGVARVSAGQTSSGDFTVQRRTFLRNYAAYWLFACTAAMTDTAGAQPAAKSSDASQGLAIFYNYALAFNPAKSRLALEEKNIKYVETKIDLFNGQSLEPWYLRLNPSASAPTLVVGDEKITESVEIIRWADRQGAPLGGDSVDRAFVDEWLNKVDAWDGNLFAAANSPAGAALKYSTEYKFKVAEANAKRNPDMAELYKEKISTLKKNYIDEPNDEAVCDANRQQLRVLLDEAETRLATNKFLAGPAYSAADAIFTPVIYRIYLLKKDGEYLSSRPNIKRYYEEIKKRPSYKKVFSVSDSALASAGEVLPAVGQVLFATLTGKY